MTKKTFFIFLLLFTFTACSANAEVAATATPTEVIVPTKIKITNSPTPPAYLPQSGDKNLTRANAFPQTMDLITVQETPLRFELVISGHLPTPCHELRVNVPPPDEENKINVEVYSVADPNMICQQVLRAFNTTVDLGSYPAGSYQVWVNGEFVGNFDA